MKHCERETDSRVTRQLSLPALECGAEPLEGGGELADCEAVSPLLMCERDCTQDVWRLRPKGSCMAYLPNCLAWQNRGSHRML